VNVTLELPFLVAVVIALIAGALAGALQEVAFWRWLRRRGSGNIAMMIISIGLSLFLRYIYLLLFGGSSRSYRAFEGVTLELGPATLGQGDLLGIGLAAFFLAVASWALLRTRLGKATRAVADNPALASASGIDVDRVINVVWIFGAALTALAGVLFGLSQQVNYELGFGLLLLMFAAVTLGGLGTAFGAIVGSIVVGLFIQLSTLVIPSELKNVGALGVLIVILLVRPQGIFGRRERVG
jgi:branched-chain amino acid transport system permease protein